MDGLDSADIDFVGAGFDEMFEDLAQAEAEAGHDLAIPPTRVTLLSTVDASNVAEREELLTLTGLLLPGPPMKQKRTMRMFHRFITAHKSPKGLGKGLLVGRERTKEGFTGELLISCEE